MQLKMKVKISYNIELDDVPSHVSELLDNVSKRLTALSQSTTNTATKVRTNQFPASVLVSTLNNLREELEIMGAVQRSRIRSAQESIVAEALKLAENHKIYLDMGAPDDDEE